MGFTCMRGQPAVETLDGRWTSFAKTEVSDLTPQNKK